MSWLKETKEHLPVLDTSDVRKYGISYKTRASWQRGLDISLLWKTSNPVYSQARQGTSKQSDREVCEMRTATTILGIIDERGKKEATNMKGMF